MPKSIIDLGGKLKKKKPKETAAKQEQKLMFQCNHPNLENSNRIKWWPYLILDDSKLDGNFESFSGFYWFLSSLTEVHGVLL